MSTITIRTSEECWVVPESVELLKFMIEHRQLRAGDICFDSHLECQFLVKRLSLLALKDECTQHAPSVIAELSRKIIQKNRH